MKYFTLLLLSFLLFSCSDNSQENLKPLNLLKHGVPITIMAPDSAEVKTMDLVVQKDITIKKGDDYNVQLFASEASAANVASAITSLKSEVQSGAYFSEFMKEEPAGFIFQIKIDSTHTSYDFRHVKLFGDKEYIFRTGLMGSFTLEQVENMYQSVQGN